MPEEKSQSEASNPPEDTLETLLIALQKTFSRVSEHSYDVAEQRARALIVGDVSFELSTRVNYGGDDHLQVRSEGDIALILSGVVRTDIREVVEDEETESAHE